MRVCPVLLLASLALAAVPSVGLGQTAEYEIARDGKVRSNVINRDDKKGRYITVRFLVKRGPRTLTELGDQADKIVIREDGDLVKELVITPPGTSALTAILALDVSGSMASGDKLSQAKRASNLFLDRLHEKANCGLVLFDDQIQTQLPPVSDLSQVTLHRQRLRQHINDSEPRGGTAWIDATATSLAMLEGIRGRKAVLVMTDGVDINSTKTLDEVIQQAINQEVAVYTLGVGEPGKNDPVTSLLVLDHSGSMSAKASDTDKVSKIQALHEAASRFVSGLRPGARTALMPFSDRPEAPADFTDNKAELKNGIEALKARGETALFDATYDALMVLKTDAENSRVVGKRAIVAMTDGKDNMSRRRVDDVIRLAQETKTPLYMLGLGRPKEIDEAVMKKMADTTGGAYYHAANRQELIRVFERLTIQLHDDGIDEASLKRLAEETGGKYLLAQDVSQLALMYGRVVDDLESTWTAEFRSARSLNDGTASEVDLRIERSGVLVSNVAKGTHERRGVVLAQMHPGVYLLLLLLLAGLLALPAGVRRLFNGAAAH
jgi:VWFA-related protein